MKTRRWEKLLWGDGNPLYNALLAPAGILYAAAARGRAKLYNARILTSHRPGPPVVSVGALSVGGSGKTPLVIALCAEFLRQGKRPAVITRGYGGKSAEKTLVVTPTTPPEEAGDEPAMMAAIMPEVKIIKAPRRKLGALFAEKYIKPDVLVLDDAFSHLELARDFDIIAVDAARGWGNGRTLPAGPLREPLSRLKRADCIIVTNPRVGEKSGNARVRESVSKYAPHCPVIEVHYRIEGLVTEAGGNPAPPERTRGKKAILFSGVGNPASFRKTAAELEVEVAGVFEFPDHYQYNRSDLKKISKAAVETGAEFALTTEKDLARLGNRRPEKIEALAPRIAAEVDDIQWLTQTILAKKRNRSLS